MGAYSKRYLCVGGPLDGQELTAGDYELSKHRDAYADYNRAGYSTRGCPSMVRIYKPLLGVIPRG